MTKQYKGAIVERVEHPATKRTGVIRLDKRSMTFFARENDTETTHEPFASSSGHEVREWLLEQLKHTTDANNLEWIPVVQIEHGGDSHHYWRDSSKEEFSESVKLEIKRYYLALTRDKREWRQLPWESIDSASSTCLPENERYAASRKYAEGPKSPNLNSYTHAFRLPAFEGRGDHRDKVVLPFTPELWDGLCLIVKRIKDAREVIAELVGTKKGVETVTEVGAGRKQLLLSSGESDGRK